VRSFHLVFLPRKLLLKSNLRINFPTKFFLPRNNQGESSCCRTSLLSQRDRRNQTLFPRSRRRQRSLNKFLFLPEGFIMLSLNYFQMTRR
jgi:hypothetical protein